jgi:hypothetical protein
MVKRNLYSRDNYWRWLGKFVDQFASVEFFAHTLLWDLGCSMHKTTFQVLLSKKRNIPRQMKAKRQWLSTCQ